VVGQGLFMALVVLGGLPGGPERGSSTTRLLGGALMSLAALVMALGAISLGRNLTPFPRPGAAPRLVRTGIYGLVRHPLYVSLIIASIGWALFRCSSWALLATLALAVFLDAKARYEEVALSQRLPEYHQYARSVRRFIPGIY